MTRWASHALFLSLLLGCEIHPECGADTEDGQAFDGPMCGERLVRTFRVSSKFTESELVQIKLAGGDWNEATWTPEVGARVVLTWEQVTPDQDWSADVVPAKLGARTGQQSSLTGLIELDPQPTDGLLRAHAVHELGHSFGLGHVADQTQAMHPNSGVLVTPADVEHFDRLWAERAR